MFLGLFAGQVRYIQGNASPARRRAGVFNPNHCAKVLGASGWCSSTCAYCQQTKAKNSCYASLGHRLEGNFAAEKCKET